ncbi:hypothetical protein [Puia dinghuensis]|uniref:Uncharacterized protein n=1 Tax=Puia dinghuensis TaxID=1792502 RepID=A0A8J2UB79_9BACT|nr:hypothetical protein [Puia dinghuensis]GGA92372.1 hypothetical protein GCM10011511_14700 [Puia dinghuensis]
MTKDNEYLVEYQAKINTVTFKYLESFKAEVSKDKRTFDTASEFLNKHNGTFRSEVAGVGVDLLHSHGLNPEAVKVVIENNGWAVSKLFVEVMNEGMGRQVFATNI